MQAQNPPEISYKTTSHTQRGPLGYSPPNWARWSLPLAPDPLGRLVVPLSLLVRDDPRSGPMPGRASTPVGLAGWPSSSQVASPMSFL